MKYGNHSPTKFDAVQNISRQTNYAWVYVDGWCDFVTFSSETPPTDEEIYEFVRARIALES